MNVFSLQLEDVKKSDNNKNINSDSTSPLSTILKKLKNYKEKKKKWKLMNKPIYSGYTKNSLSSIPQKYEIILLNKDKDELKMENIQKNNYSKYKNKTQTNCIKIEKKNANNDEKYIEYNKSNNNNENHIENYMEKDIERLSNIGKVTGNCKMINTGNSIFSSYNSDNVNNKTIFPQSSSSGDILNKGFIRYQKNSNNETNKSIIGLVNSLSETKVITSSKGVNSSFIYKIDNENVETERKYNKLMSIYTKIKDKNENNPNNDIKRNKIKYISKSNSMSDFNISKNSGNNSQFTIAFKGQGRVDNDYYTFEKKYLPGPGYYDENKGIRFFDNQSNFRYKSLFAPSNNKSVNNYYNASNNGSFNSSPGPGAYDIRKNLEGNDIYIKLGSNSKRFEHAFEEREQASKPPPGTYFIQGAKNYINETKWNKNKLSPCFVDKLKQDNNKLIGLHKKEQLSKYICLDVDKKIKEKVCQNLTKCYSSFDINKGFTINNNNFSEMIKEKNKLRDELRKAELAKRYLKSSNEQEKENLISLSKNSHKLGIRLPFISKSKRIGYLEENSKKHSIGPCYYNQNIEADFIKKNKKAKQYFFYNKNYYIMDN